MPRLIDADALLNKAYWHGDTPDVGKPYPDGAWSCIHLGALTVLLLWFFVASWVKFIDFVR